MGEISTRQQKLAPFLATMGAGLLAFARPLSVSLPQNDFVTVILLNYLVWAACLVCGIRYVKADLSSPAIKRGLFVIAVFAIGAFPFVTGNSDITAKTFSIIGIILFIYGAIMWTGAHPLFARLGRAIGLHRFIQPHLFLIIIYAAFLSMALGLSWYCFGFIPGYPDAIAQYVHGKFMAAGQVYGESPALRYFFPMSMMVNDGKWYAQYQPLHEAILGLGHVVGAPWLVNPLEGALTVVVIYLLARRVFGEATARIAGVFSLGCTFMLFMSSEFMNHATALLFTTLLAYCYIEMLESLPHNRKVASVWALAAGFCLGAVFLARPLDAVGVGMPFIIHAIAMLRREFSSYIKPYLLMAVAGLACLLLALWFNQQTTGDAFLFPSGRYHRSNNFVAMGFNKENFSVGHFLGHITYKTQSEWLQMNRKLFEWWLPCTFFVMLFCLLPIHNRYARLLLGVVISHTIVNMANQFTSAVFGPRYLYATASMLVILTAAGVARIPLFLQMLRMRLPEKPVLHGIITFSLLLVFSAGWIPLMPPLIRGLTHFFDNHPDFYASMLQQSQKPALIFIGRGDDPKSKYKWVTFANPPSEDADVIFAIDRGDEEDHMLMARYPDRHAYAEFNDALIPFDAIGPGNVMDSKSQPSAGVKP